VPVRIFLSAILLFASQVASAQSKPDMKALLKDSLDGKFDFSDFLITTPGGFIPVPAIITEPALGSFGLVIAPVFIKKRPPAVSNRNGITKLISTPPDISGGALMYTANNSYAAFAFRTATLLKPMIRYRAGGGYANINLNFYRTGLDGVERKYGLNFKTFPLSATFLKLLPGTRWSGGIKYLFLKTSVSSQEGSLPTFVQANEVNSVVSMPGMVIEYEGRDNVFTPDKGLRLQGSMSFSNNAFGSDYNYSRLDVYGYYYFPLRKNLIGGVRTEVQQVYGDVPFYLRPYISLRGLPIARYQGDIASVAETEVRWDVVRRWSAVFFAGSGKAFDSWSEFSAASWHSSGGAGVRYLAARKYKLRMGMDIARGPDQWAYYIVFGSSWGR
jgi:hypothetical protein